MRRLLAFGFVSWALGGCVGPEDNPTKVHDLRVLAVSFEPPELLAPTCVQDLQALAIFASPVRMTALLADPKGEGRTLDWHLWACPSQSDPTCAHEGDRVRLASGSGPEGEPSVVLRPGATLYADGTPMLQRVAEQDVYKGLGGLRLPLSLNVRAGDEEVFAQKLMVFSCRFFPDMKANRTPKVPGLLVDGTPWPADQELALSGPGPFRIEPEDFSDQEESYVVPSFELRPVNLTESWKLSWHTDLGSLSPAETGGTALDGVTTRHFVKWQPPRAATEQTVRFWVVARDGRGGTSWLLRKARYTP